MKRLLPVTYHIPSAARTADKYLFHFKFILLITKANAMGKMVCKTVSISIRLKNIIYMKQYCESKSKVDPLHAIKALGEREIIAPLS
jgi:hypothetical protein